MQLFMFCWQWRNVSFTWVSNFVVVKFTGFQKKKKEISDPLNKDWHLTMTRLEDVWGNRGIAP
jgi:hypothetical protein